MKIYIISIYSAGRLWRLQTRVLSNKVIHYSCDPIQCLASNQLLHRENGFYAESIIRQIKTADRAEQIIPPTIMYVFSISHPAPHIILIDRIIYDSLACKKYFATAEVRECHHTYIIPIQFLHFSMCHAIVDQKAIFMHTEIPALGAIQVTTKFYTFNQT